MNKNHRIELKSQSRQCLANASYSPKKLILIHTGAALLLSFLLTVADYLLEQQIGSTGGLSGIGSRSVLTTMQTILLLAQTVLLPFWQMGYVFVSLKLSREETTSPWDLCEGFRCFGPVLRLNLLKIVVFVAIAFVSFNIANTVFFLTPFAAPIMETLGPILYDPSAMNDPVALQNALSLVTEEMIAPLIIIMAIVYLAISLPVFYRFRMASYFLLDNDQPRALASIINSWKMMRHQCINMLKLDVSFWWFYSLEILIGLVCYGDVILQWLGVPLPFSADAGYFLFLGLYLISQLALYLWRKNEVEVTYTCAYNFLKSNHTPSHRPKPQDQPWVY